IFIMERFYKIAFIAAIVCIPLLIISLFGVLSSLTGVFAIAFFVFLAIGIRQFDHVRKFSFTVSVFAAVALSMFYPSTITEVNGFNTQQLIVPLIQIIMFGMGTAMSIKDFAG